MDFFAGAFFAVDFFAVDFFAGDFFAGDFFAGAFFAGATVAGAFFAGATVAPGDAFVLFGLVGADLREAAAPRRGSAAPAFVAAARPT